MPLLRKTMERDRDGLPPIIPRYDSISSLEMASLGKNFDSAVIYTPLNLSHSK